MQSSAAAAMQAQYEMLGTRTAEKYDVFRLVNSVEAPHFRIEPRVLFQVRGKKPNMPDLTYAENHIKTEHEKHKNTRGSWMTGTTACRLATPRRLRRRRRRGGPRLASG